MLKLCFDRRGIEAKSIAVKEGKFLSETDVRQLRPKGDVALTDVDGTSAQQPVFISVDGKRGVRFSRNAEECFRRYGKNLTMQDMRNLVEIIDRLRRKDRKEALIYFRDNLAMVVSVQNRTIVTAVGEDSIPGRFFTDIDSVAIL